MTIVDPYMRPQNIRARRVTKKNMENWYKGECNLLGLSVEDDPSLDIKKWDCSFGNKNIHSRQYDAVSCGPFTCMYIAYKMKMGRLPTNDDFTEADMPNIRNYIIYTILSANQSIEKNGYIEYDHHRITEMDNEHISSFSANPATLVDDA